MSTAARIRELIDGRFIAEFFTIHPFAGYIWEWKDNAMWYLVREMRGGEVAEVYEFCEKSGFGMIEGKVIIKESK